MIMMQENYILKNLQKLVCRLSELVGIIPFYINYKGEKVDISLETKLALLSSMGFEIDEKNLTDWIDYFENYPWLSFLEDVYVTSEKPKISIYLKGEKPKQLKIEIKSTELINSDGISISFYHDFSSFNIQEERNLKDGSYLKYCINLPPLPFGYYELKAYTEEQDFHSVLIVAPKEAYKTFKGKTWGLHLNLWSLRGKDREGDFSNLKEIAKFTIKNGGFISINPLHFNNPLDQYGISPYAALTRQFKTPLYISAVKVYEVDRELFKYENVWNQKILKLRERYKKFYQNLNNNIADAKAFKQYKNSLCETERQDLKYFAVFCFLNERLGSNWQNWEEKFKKPNPQVIEKTYNENQRKVVFYEYLQWLVENELESLRKYNLCLDLGFGSVKSSFDVWLNQEIYALNAEYGAPPDDFNPRGQKWGFPPVIPFKLRKKAYLPFIKTIRSNMKSKLLRVDHALGLFRAFWIPNGKEPYHGAYVRNNWQEILGIICLESHINKTEVIGEDLGTAEEWMKEELMKRKISSWKVFYFEKNESGFKPAETYPEEALCSITTHDLPTFKGFWKGRDIELRKAFSIFDETTYKKAIEKRIKEREQILSLLETNQLLDDRDNFENILLSVINFLSQTKSKYLLLYPEDILMIEEQTNFPGTTTEHPNWQRKLPLSVDEFLKLPIWEKIFSILKETGRTNSN